MFLARFKSLGPGLLVTAAFIGPGTVITASNAGARFGFALLWSLVFAVAATIVLQEMAARLGLVSRQGLGEAVRSSFRHPLARAASCLLIVSAIGLGNAAYQAGNLTGAAVGLEVLTGLSVQVWSLVVGGFAFVLLAAGMYKAIERVLIALVVIMSLLFVATAILVRPEPTAVLRGMAVPSLPPESLLTVIGLIGTTVVPYNLFLHASSVREKWPQSTPVDQALGESRLDTTLSIGLGGVITLAIMTTAASAFFGHAAFDDVSQLAGQLAPLLGGRAATVCFAVGLLAAGTTSAITAPLAAAYAVSGAFGWRQDLKAWPFRAVWFAVLATGTLIAALGWASPTQTILLAQVANGLLLPAVAVFLLIAVNRRDLMGRYRNGLWGNLVGGLVVLIAAALNVYTVVNLLRPLFG